MANGEEILKFLEEELEEFEKLYRELMGKNLKIFFYHSYKHLFV